MNEKQTTPAVVRPTKKQRQLLTFIGSFISEHGYSPSYREIMAGLGYTSVATVALHVRSLIARGHLRKRDYSARSLELTQTPQGLSIVTNEVAPHEEKWLVEKVEHLFRKAEETTTEVQAIDSLQVVLGALRILGLDAAAQSFLPRLQKLKLRK
jgi:SOS-response transcriptional repressor LexA